LAFSPTLLAHASLATHDMTFAFHATLALIVMSGYLRSPSRWRLLAAALTTSLAVSSKYTGVLLLPCFLLGLTVRHLPDLLRSRHDVVPAHRWSWVRHVRPGVRYVVLTLIFTWALHGFEVAGGRLLRFQEPSPNNIWMRIFGPGFPGSLLARIIP